MRKREIEIICEIFAAREWDSHGGTSEAAGINSVRNQLFDDLKIPIEDYHAACVWEIYKWLNPQFLDEHLMLHDCIMEYMERYGYKSLVDFIEENYSIYDRSDTSNVIKAIYRETLEHI